MDVEWLNDHGDICPARLQVFKNKLTVLPHIRSALNPVLCHGQRYSIEHPESHLLVSRAWTSESDPGSDSESDADLDGAMCALERTNEDCAGILYDISKEIPEGQYLKLCENLKIMYKSGKSIRRSVEKELTKMECEAKHRSFQAEVIGRMARTIDSSRKALIMSKGKFKQTEVAKVLGDTDRYCLSEEADDEMIIQSAWNLSLTSDVRVRLRESSTWLD